MPPPDCYLNVAINPLSLKGNSSKYDAINTLTNYYDFYRFKIKQKHKYRYNKQFYKEHESKQYISFDHIHDKRHNYFGFNCNDSVLYFPKYINAIGNALDFSNYSLKTNNLIMGVSKNFKYNNIKGLFYGFPYLDDTTNRGENKPELLFLSKEFLSYVNSLKFISNYMDNAKKTAGANKKAYHYSFIKLALYADYKPESIEFIRKIFGNYYYKFYSKRKEKKFRVKIPAKKPYQFTVK